MFRRCLEGIRSCCRRDLGVIMLLRNSMRWLVCKLCNWCLGLWVTCTVATLHGKEYCFFGPYPPWLELTQWINQQTNVKEIINLKFLYPRKKPKSFKSPIKETKLSSVLSKKDFEKAKEVFVLIKAKKWNSAIKLSKKIKDKEFKNLVTWMYLKERSNRATFNDYAIFIRKNEFRSTWRG